jgi:hypothetical protein
MPGPLLQSLTAARYADVADAYGTPAYRPVEVRAASRRARAGADETLVRGLDVAPLPGATSSAKAPVGTVRVRRGTRADDIPGSACSMVQASGAGDAVVDLRADALDVVVEATSGVATLRAGAFAPASQPIGTVAAGDAALVVAPAVSRARPWTLQVRTPGAIRLCAPAR